MPSLLDMPKTNGSIQLRSYSSRAHSASGGAKPEMKSSELFTRVWLAWPAEVRKDSYHVHYTHQAKLLFYFPFFVSF